MLDRLECGVVGSQLQSLKALLERRIEDHCHDVCTILGGQVNPCRSLPRVGVRPVDDHVLTLPQGSMGLAFHGLTISKLVLITPHPGVGVVCLDR